jgi:hypothetical protein
MLNDRCRVGSAAYVALRGGGRGRLITTYHLVHQVHLLESACLEEDHRGHRDLPARWVPRDHLGENVDVFEGAFRKEI